MPQLNCQTTEFAGVFLFLGTEREQKNICNRKKPIVFGIVSIRANERDAESMSANSEIFQNGLNVRNSTQKARFEPFSQTISANRGIGGSQMALSAEMKKAQTPKEIVIEWIDHILDRKKWTGTDLARHSELAPSTILRLLNNPKHQFVPTVATLQKIANGSGYPIPKKVMAALGAEGEGHVASGDEMEPDNIRPVRARLPRQATVQLRHISSLPASLQSAVGGNRDAYVPAPPQLEGDETAFAFHMPDNTFDPWFKSGTLMFATKRRDPVAGDTLLVADKGGRSRVRLLMDITEKGLKLSKSLPAVEDEVLNFDEIQDIAVVTVFVKI